MCNHLSTFSFQVIRLLIHNLFWSFFGLLGTKALIINLNLMGMGDLLYEISLDEICRNVPVERAGNSLDGVPYLRYPFVSSPCLLFLCIYRHSLQSIRKDCFISPRVCSSACAWPVLHLISALAPSLYMVVAKFRWRAVTSFNYILGSPRRISC